MGRRCGRVNAWATHARPGAGMPGGSGSGLGPGRFGVGGRCSSKRMVRTPRQRAETTSAAYTVATGADLASGPFHGAHVFVLSPEAVAEILAFVGQRPRRTNRCSGRGRRQWPVARPGCASRAGPRRAETSDGQHQQTHRRVLSTVEHGHVRRFAAQQRPYANAGFLGQGARFGRGVSWASSVQQRNVVGGLRLSSCRSDGAAQLRRRDGCASAPAHACTCGQG